MRQPKIRYHLEKKTNQRNEPELLMASISYGFKRLTKKGILRSVPLKISLQSRILPKHFGKQSDNYSFNSKIFNKHSSQNGHARTSMKLLEMAVEKLAVNYSINKIIPSPQHFKDALMLEIGRKINPEEIKTSIVEMMVERIKYLESIKGTSKKDAVAEGTIKSYRSVLLHLENYEIATDKILYFEDFDESIYWHLWDVTNDIYRGNLMIENPRSPKKKRTDLLGYAAKSMQKYQKNLVAFMRTVKKDVKIKIDLDNPNLILSNTAARKNTIVTLDEIKKIINSDVSFDEDLQSAKEYLVIATLTGLRYEGVVEASGATVNQINEDGYSFNYIHINLGKVNETVIIPLMLPVVEIIKANGGQIPKPSGSAEINENLKKLYRYLKFDNSVKLVRTTFKGEDVTTFAKKSDVISTHDARRGFITNLNRLKFPKEHTMNLTHPKSNNKDMHELYNKSSLLDKAKDFVFELRKIESDIYKV